MTNTMKQNNLPARAQPPFPDPMIESCVRVSGYICDMEGVTKRYFNRLLVKRKVSTLFSHAGKFMVDGSDVGHSIRSSDDSISSCDGSEYKKDSSDLPAQNERAYLICDRIRHAIYGQVYDGIVLYRSSPDDVWQMTSEKCAIKEMIWEKINEGRRHDCAENPRDEIAAMQHVVQCLTGIRDQEVSAHDTMRESKVIVPLDFLFDNLHLYSITPFYTGGEMYALLQNRNGFSEEESRYLLGNILDGLESLQKVGICHRDISLENILVDHEMACVIDMGMCLRIPFLDDEDNANILRNVDHRDRNEKRCLISSQPRAGKLQYMAPEVYNEEPFDGYAADMWAVGVCLYAMLTGGTSWEIPDKDDSYYHYISSGNLTKLIRQWRIPLSENAVDLLQQMLRKNPHDRLDLQQVRNHPWMDGHVNNPMEDC